MENERRRTLIETPVTPPVKGVVFVHTSRPDNPMIVSGVDGEGEVWRVDSRGDLAPWGGVEDWFDEVRRRTIEVVYVPARIV